MVNDMPGNPVPEGLGLPFLIGVEIEGRKGGGGENPRGYQDWVHHHEREASLSLLLRTGSQAIAKSLVFSAASPFKKKLKNQLQIKHFLHTQNFTTQESTMRSSIQPHEQTVEAFLCGKTCFLHHVFSIHRKIDDQTIHVGEIYCVVILSSVLAH